MSAAACRAPSTSRARRCSARACALPLSACSTGALLQGRRASHRGQHPRSRLDHRRHPRTGAGDAGLRTRNPATGRQIRPRDRQTGFADVQDYVERAVRQRLAALPDGEWETQDFIDRDPSGSEGLIPIKIKLTIKGDRAIYDFTGSHPTIGSIYNSAFGTTFSAVAAGMKTFFPTCRSTAASIGRSRDRPGK